MPPPSLGYDLRRQQQETQWRLAAHVYLWRELFMLSTVYADRRVLTSNLVEGNEVPTLTPSKEMRLIFTYRF